MNQQRILDLSVPTIGQSEFVVFDSNRLASQFLGEWPSANHQGLERCTILFGESGSGKSHLAKDWGTEIRL